MTGIGISFGFDELPADGEVCQKCNQAILTGIKYKPYVTVGDTTETRYLKAICEACYNRVNGEGEE